MKKERESCQVSDISLGFYVQCIHVSSWLNFSTVVFRSLVLNGNNEGQLLFQKAVMTEDYKFTWTSNSSSAESLTESDNLMTERSSDSDEHKGGAM